MSELSTLEKWEVPSSMGLGFHYYYRNILKGSEYLNNFIRETFAWCDNRLTPALRSIYDEGQSTRANDRPKYGWDGIFHLLEGGGVDKVTIKQMDSILSHMAYRRGDSIDFLQLKEFFAYCGIDGIYDFEKNRHFAVQPTIKVLPLTLQPDVWQKREDIEAARLEIASLMAPKGYLQEFDAEIEELTSSTWREYGKVAMAKFHEDDKVPGEDFQKAYVAEHPEMHAPLARIEELKTIKLIREAEMKDKFAPLGEAFVLPAVGTPYNLDWNDSFEKIMGRPTEFKDRLMAYHKDNLIKRSDPRFLKFSFDSVRLRAFSMSDWALRDFTMSEVNRGVNGPVRRHDIPRNFVKAVLQEKEDGLLGILQTPHRIEFLDPEKKRFRLVFNNLEVETITMDKVMAMKFAQEKEDIKLAQEGSPLVRKYDIEPIPVVERVAQKLEWEFPEEVKHLVTMVDGFDDDADLVEEREMQAFDAAIDARLAELATQKEQEVNAVVPNQSPEALESASAPLAEEGTLTGEVNELSSPAPPESALATYVEDAAAEPSVDPSSVTAESTLDDELAASAVSTSTAEIDDESVEAPVVEVTADSVASEAVTESSDAPAPEPEAVEKSLEDTVEESLDDIVVQFDVARQLDASTAKPAADKTVEDELPADEHGDFFEDEGNHGLAAPHRPNSSNKPAKEKAKDPRVEEANAKFDESVKREQAEKERQRKDEERKAEFINAEMAKREEQRKAFMGRPMSGAPGTGGMGMGGMGGMGGGMGGMGMGGMGRMGNQHMPQSFTVDLGLNTLFGGLRDVGRSAMNGVSRKIAGATVDVEKRAELLNANADAIVAIRERLDSGKSDTGEALTADELLQNWGGLKDAMKNIKTGLKGVARLPDDKITDDLMASLKHAGKAVDDVKPLVNESTQKPGKVGEAAKEAQAAMDKISETLQMLIKMLLRAFSKDKSAAPEL